MTFTKLALAGFIAAAVTATTAQAASIQGNWRTASGETAQISKCGSAFCITVRSGAHNGKRIGRMTGSGSNYSGTIKDPSNGRSYSGTAVVSGATMKMKGCALKVFCRTQTWRKR